MSDGKGEIVLGGGPAPLVQRSIYGAGVLDEALRLAQVAVKSGLVPYRSADAAVFVILTGHELGISPLQALRGFHVLNGRPTPSADLLVALAKRSGQCEFFRLVESTPERAVYETKRKGDPEPTRIAFTLDDAKRAGLDKRDTWRQHPGAMLRARCAAQLVRAVYPDAALGLYDPDEAEDFGERSAPARASVIEVLPPEPAPAPTGPVLDPIDVVDEKIDAAKSEADLTAAAAALRALGLTKGHPERERLIQKLASRGAALGLKPTKQPAASAAPTTPAPQNPAPGAVDAYPLEEVRARAFEAATREPGDDDPDEGEPLPEFDSPVPPPPAESEGQRVKREVLDAQKERKAAAKKPATSALMEEWERFYYGAEREIEGKADELLPALKAYAQQLREAKSAADVDNAEALARDDGLLAYETARILADQRRDHFITQPGGKKGGAK